MGEKFSLVAPISLYFGSSYFSALRYAVHIVSLPLVEKIFLLRLIVFIGFSADSQAVVLNFDQG